MINQCPNCNTNGQNIDNATIKCMIKVSLHRVEDVKHQFCANADCDVVYFAEDDSEIFHTADMRERVYQKEPDKADVLVCYCFFYTLNDIQTESRASENSAIVDDIKYGIKQGHCACDWRNPQGNCCLGNVINLVKAAQSV